VIDVLTNLFIAGECLPQASGWQPSQPQSTLATNAIDDRSETDVNLTAANPGSPTAAPSAVKCHFKLSVNSNLALPSARISA